MSKYKDSMGRFRTFSLFKEVNMYTDNYEAVWTLHDEDKEGYPSLKKIYMRYRDPTEYKFAMDTFGSYQHWEKLCKAAFFKDTVAKWRDELSLAIKSDAIDTLITQSKSPKGITAAKWLAEGGWTTGDSKRGRPSKEEIQRELKTRANLQVKIKDYAQRVGLNEPKSD